MRIRCFLPCRKGSERVPRKNVRTFAGHPHGLLEVKLKQLLACTEVEEVVLSSNDDEVLGYGESLGSPRIRLHQRSELLSAASTSTDELVAHAVELIPDGDILWTHVTSPFLDTACYSQIIRAYEEGLTSGFDSLMTTTPLRSFIWNERGPVNYDREREKWPRTQTLPVLHEVNSGVFLSSADNYRKFQDRIGARPLLFELGRIQGFDVDWQDDFRVAEALAVTGVG